MLSNNWMKGWNGRAAWLLVLMLVIATGGAAAQTVPSIVISQQSTVPANGLSGPGKVVQDSCGNLYELEHGGNLLEITAGSGGQSHYIANYGGQGADGLSGGLAIDSNNNLYVGSKWNGIIEKIPSTNCVPNSSNATVYASAGTSLGNTWGFYWFDPGDIAVNSAGTVFITGQYPTAIVGLTSSGTALLITSSPGGQPESLAADAAGDVFFTLSGSGKVYEIAAANYGTSTPTVLVSGLNNALGLSFDAAGNLFVGDSSAGSIYEIPYNASTSALAPGSMFLVASGLPVGNPLAVSLGGNAVFYTSGNDANIYQQILGAANLGSVAVAGSLAGSVDVAFNTSVTPAAIGFKGAFASGTQAASGACAVGTAYTAGNSCTIAATFSPTVPGLAEGALVLADSTGVALASANLSGVGLGAGLTADPGTVSSAIGSGYTTPTSTAIDAAGDLFIADSGANVVWEIAAKTSTPVSIGSGLTSPKGVAVDGAGNLFIADTGANRIVEVPIVNGALSTAAQTELLASSTSVAGATLSSPAGLSLDAQGNLYIADSGNSRIVYLPYNGGWNVAYASTLGSGWKNPLAVTVTASGLIYVADSGNGIIDSISYAPGAVGKVLLATGFNNPSALATDAAGDLFVVDQGNAKVVRIPSISGSLVTTSALDVSIGIANPYGLALDPAGNLHVSDNVNAAVYAVNRTSPTQFFGKWNPGTTSAAGTFLLENSGNTQLVLNTPYYVATGDTADFTELSSESSACADAGTVATGSSCYLEVTFTPASLATYSEVVALSSNATNVTAPAAPQVTFTGTGATTVATTTTLTITSPSGSPYAGEAIALTATVTSASDTPIGNVALLVDGTQVANATLNSSGVVTFSLPNGLNGGNHTLQAAYAGADSADGFTSYSYSASAIQQITVTQLASTTTLSISTAYYNPASQNAGTPLTFTATVASAFAGVPSGAVTFVITDAAGGTPVTLTGTLAATAGGFQASATYTPTAPISSVYDVISVVATYSGDVNFTGSISAAGTFDLAPASGSVSFAASGTSVTSSDVTGGTITFTPTSLGGWTGIVGYSCLASSLPQYTHCVWSPGQAELIPSTSASTAYQPTVTLTLAIDQPPQTPTASKLVWWMGGLTGLALLFVRRRWMRKGLASFALLAGVILLGVSATGLTACNGINGIQYPTPTGKSTITVYASSDPFTSGSTTVTQACGINPTTKLGDPTLGPCSQKTYQVTLTVQN